MNVDRKLRQSQAVMKSAARKSQSVGEFIGVVQNRAPTGRAMNDGKSLSEEILGQILQTLTTPQRDGQLAPAVNPGRSFANIIPIA